MLPKSLYFNLTYKIDKDILKSKKDAIMTEIIKYMNIFGLEIYIPTLKNKVATKLSKGQIQKVNIIYVILNIIFSNTKLLFLDESTSNIDGPMEKIIINKTNCPFLADEDLRQTKSQTVKKSYKSSKVNISWVFNDLARVIETK